MSGGEGPFYFVRLTAGLKSPPVQNIGSCALPFERIELQIKSDRGRRANYVIIERL